MGNSVVYKWLREDGTPYYIGIGKPERPYTGRRSCGPPPPKDRIIVLYEGLDWQTACDIEKNLIAFYGRKDLGTGVLRNLTDGGEGVQGHRHTKESKEKMSRASAGRRLTEESKKKISEAHRGENHYLYGKKHTEDSKKRMSESHRGSKHTDETKKKMSESRRGKKPSEETRRKISNSNTGKTHSEDTKMKLSEKLSGENHPNFGKNLKDVTREKISKSNSGKKHTEETKAKISKAKSGEKAANYTPRNWYHPVHGEVLQGSISDLVKMFPEQKLHKGSLSAVALGKRPHHKRWEVLENTP